MRDNTIWVVEYKTPTMKYWSPRAYCFWSKKQAERVLKCDLNTAAMSPNNPVLDYTTTGTKFRIRKYKRE